MHWLTWYSFKKYFRNGVYVPPIGTVSRRTLPRELYFEVHSMLLLQHYNIWESEGLRKSASWHVQKNKFLRRFSWRALKVNDGKTSTARVGHLGSAPLEAQTSGFGALVLDFFLAAWLV